MAHALRRELASALLRSPHFQPPAAAAAAASLVRHFSASTTNFAAAREENIREANKWRKITAVGYGICICLGIYIFATEEHHEPHERPEYPYLHIRNKEFPWGPDGLFEKKHHEH